MDDSIDSGNFSVRGYLPLVPKDSSSHMHGLAVYVKGLPFAQNLPLENSEDSYLCFRLALFKVSFLQMSSPSSSLCMVPDSISSVLLINPSAVFVFGDFNVHHKE